MSRLDRYYALGGLALLVLLAGCSGPGPGAKTPTVQMSGSAAALRPVFNPSDLAFARMMVPHHEQATEMAALTDTRAADARVKIIAARIKKTQGSEVSTMSGWLSAAGDPPDAGMSGMQRTGSTPPGLVSDQDMTALRAASGSAFDKKFLTMMIGHHEAGIQMAEDELAQGGSDDAKSLARQIIDEQRAEISTMKTLRAQL